MSEANKRQVGGSHYKADGQGEEHWDRAVRLKLNYFQAQITKYIERAPLKNGKQDVEKALHFCQKYLERYDDLHPVDTTKEATLQINILPIEGFDPSSINSIDFGGEAHIVNLLPIEGFDPSSINSIDFGGEAHIVNLAHDAPDGDGPGASYVDQDRVLCQRQVSSFNDVPRFCRRPRGHDGVCEP